MSKEQDELAYQELIAKVATINKDAADYMQGPMRKIYNFAPSGNLWEVVIWWKHCKVKSSGTILHVN